MSEQDQPKSKYKALTPFIPQSKIPAHLLAVLNEQERYMVESMSKLEQRNEWLEKAALEDRSAVIDLDERMAATEKWRSVLSSKWSVIIGLALICAPIIIKLILEKWIK